MAGLTESSKHREIKDFRSWNEAMVAKHDPEAYHLRSHWLIRAIERMRVRAILKAIDHQRGVSVLEVGCGAGNVLEQVREAHLVGIDLSRQMVKRTRERLAGHRVSVLQADAEFLPFDQNSFEEIMCTEVMEHVRSPEAIIYEMWRVAKPGARVAISIPNEKVINNVKDWIQRLGLRPWFSAGGYEVPERMDDEWHLHVFDLDLITRKLAPRFQVKKIIILPSPLLPLRFVFSCTPSK